MIKTVEKLEKDAPADPFSDSKPATTQKSRRSEACP